MDLSNEQLQLAYRLLHHLKKRGEHGGFLPVKESESYDCERVLVRLMDLGMVRRIDRGLAYALTPYGETTLGQMNKALGTMLDFDMGQRLSRASVAITKP